jgi:hypothetical protein
MGTLSICRGLEALSNNKMSLNSCLDRSIVPAAGCLRNKFAKSKVEYHLNYDLLSISRLIGVQSG